MNQDAPLKTHHEQMMNSRYNGYLQVPKKLFYFLIKSPNLSIGASMLYLELVSTASWGNNVNLDKVLLPVTKLSEHLGISRNTIKKWIKQLQTTGLITLTPDKYITINHYMKIFKKHKKGELSPEILKQKLSKLFPLLLNNNDDVSINDNTTLERSDM